MPTKRAKSKRRPDRLIKDTGVERAFGKVISGLRSEDPSHRNGTAIDLRDFLEDAREALWWSIRRPANKNNRGTLIWTLEMFDCSDYFRELLQLTLRGNYEVQCHALSILQKQSFVITKSQFRAARRAVDALRPRKNLPESDLVLLRRELNEVLTRIQQSVVKSK